MVVRKKTPIWDVHRIFFGKVNHAKNRDDGWECDS